MTQLTLFEFFSKIGSHFRTMNERTDSPPLVRSRSSGVRSINSCYSNILAKSSIFSEKKHEKSFKLKKFDSFLIKKWVILRIFWLQRISQKMFQVNFGGK